MKRYRAIADYYDAENDHHAMLRQDVPFLLSQLPSRRSLDILELAVGTGRAAIPLAQSGHKVVGVDFAPDMLAIARAKRDGLGLTERQLKLVEGDLLQLNLGRSFDWICLLFNTFMNFTQLPEQDAVLQAARRHLKPKGRFWLDVFYPDFDLLAQDRQMLDPYAFYVPRLERTVYKTARVKRDVRPQVQRVTFDYQWFDDAGRSRRQKTQFDVTYMTPRELQLLLERNGFVVEQSFGEHDGAPLTSRSSRMIARCKRAD